MLNPYLMLGLVVCAVALFGAGYGVGSEHTRDSLAAEQLAMSNQIVDELKSEIAASQQRAVEEALLERRMSDQSKDAKAKGVADAARLTNRKCDLDTVSFGLLKRSIDTANGKTGDTSPVPNAVSGNTVATK